MRAPFAPLFAALAAALAGACSIGTAADENSAFPVSSSYPPGTMERFEFSAPLPEAWRISALRTPERPEAAWKIVVITGTPSWSEYWAPTIAAAPENREIIVADRPGFAQSQPKAAVQDIETQAAALAPLLQAHDGERILLLGQSYGAAIAIRMAQAHPDKVDALVLASAYFGERGPTARRMYGVGRALQWALPRDLKNSITEVRHQKAQLPGVYEALEHLEMPVLFVHGGADSFITPQTALAFAERYHREIIMLDGGDHFLNACCVPGLLDAVEQAIARAEAAPEAALAGKPAAPASP